MNTISHSAQFDRPARLQKASVAAMPSFQTQPHVDADLREFFAEVVPNAGIRDVNEVVKSLLNDARVVDAASIACLPLVDIIRHGLPMEAIAALVGMYRSRRLSEVRTPSMTLQQMCRREPERTPISYSQMCRPGPDSHQSGTYRPMSRQGPEDQAALSRISTSQPIATIDNKLFVGNLPSNVTEEDLIPVFTQFFHVEYIKILQPKDHFGRFCAFVKYNSPAEVAINTLHENEVEPGVVLAVKWPTTISPEEPDRKVFVGNLPAGTTKESVCDMMKKFGEVEDVSTIIFKGSSEPGYCFVKYRDVVQRCIDALSGIHYLPSSTEPLVVRRAIAKEAKEEGRIMGQQKDGAAPFAWTEEEDVKLFIGNLKSTITKENLVSWFAPFGQVAHAHINEGNLSASGNACAFVQYHNPILSCVAALNTKGTLRGHTMEVRKANGTEPGRIFVGGLPANVTKPEILEIFSPFGNVDDIYVMFNPNKQTMACAFVTFLCPVTLAINELNGMVMPENYPQSLAVRIAASGGERPNKKIRVQ